MPPIMSRAADCHARKGTRHTRAGRSACMAVVLALLPFTRAHAETPFPAWLAGTWAMESGSAWADEVWTSPRGDLMLGLGKSGFGPKVEKWETVRIERRPGVGLVLVAQAKNAAAIDFPLALASGEAIEFANPQNAFPQRIRWWREGQLLMSEQSKMDGSEAVRVNYRPVETAPHD